VKTILLGLPALAVACGIPTVDRDVVYDARFGATTSMDIYLPDGAGQSRPTVLFIHGGSWSGGDKNHFFDMGPRLADSGFVAASINYRLVPDGVFPRNIQDCICSLAFLRANASNYGIDPDRIAVMGYSAGAHLASLVGVAADDPELQPDCDAAAGAPVALPAAVISGSGPQDMRKFWDEIGPDKSGVEAIFGGSPAALPHAYDLGSPITHVRSDAPPYLIMYDVLDRSGNGEMRDALVAAGDDATIMEIDASLHILEQHDDVGVYEGGMAIETPEAWIAIENLLFNTIAKGGAT
jgi:acetyl esterase/lipase